MAIRSGLAGDDKIESEREMGGMETSDFDLWCRNVVVAQRKAL